MADRMLPTPEFLAKHSVEEVETRQAGKRRMRVTDQLWIDYYLKHGHINRHQHAAAEQLLALYQAAGRTVKMTGNLDALPAGAGGISNRAADAFADFNKLARRMGRESFRCVQNVVLHNMSAPEWARAAGRADRAATELLRLCLDDLEDAFKKIREPDYVR